LELYKTTGDQKYKDSAVENAAKLVKLQVTQPIDPVSKIRGFFRRDERRDTPFYEIKYGWRLIALCDILEAFPDHPNAGAWREAVRMNASDYLAAMAARNDFGIVPLGLFVGDDPGGSRKIGKYWYRYFSRPGTVGINANLASAGVGLIKASRLLKDPALAAVAQRQLDWIIGVNPFNASTMEGVGCNQPERYHPGEFRPGTPQIMGAVMNGINGTADDEANLDPGSWPTCEYWTPMVCFTMWLMAELQTN
jgi:hypothetical protein